MEGNFFAEDGHFICEGCYDSQYLPTCARCLKKISEKSDATVKSEFYVIGELQLHKSCFSCFDCNKVFEDGKAFNNDGKLYCHDHYRSAKQAMKT